MKQLSRSIKVVLFLHVNGLSFFIFTSFEARLPVGNNIAYNLLEYVSYVYFVTKFCTT